MHMAINALNVAGSHTYTVIIPAWVNRDRHQILWEFRRVDHKILIRVFKSASRPAVLDWKEFLDLKVLSVLLE